MRREISDLSAIRPIRVNIAMYTRRERSYSQTVIVDWSDTDNPISIVPRSLPHRFFVNRRSEWYRYHRYRIIKITQVACGLSRALSNGHRTIIESVTESRAVSFPALCICHVFNFRRLIITINYRYTFTRSYRTSRIEQKSKRDCLSITVKGNNHSVCNNHRITR